MGRDSTILLSLSLSNFDIDIVGTNKFLNNRVELFIGAIEREKQRLGFVERGKRGASFTKEIGDRARQHFGDRVEGTSGDRAISTLPVR